MQSDKSQLKEEIANAVTHGVGALAAVCGIVSLLAFAEVSFSAGLLVYAVTLILLYLVSTLYHSLAFTRARNVFRKLDHMAIYVFIAGTYTPFCLNVLEGWTKWTLLIAIWTLAIGGVVMKCFLTGKLEWLSLAIYISMGWMVMFVIKPVYSSLSDAGFWLLVSGGIAYTLGTFFYMCDRIRYSHSIWHLWVVAGSSFHFFSIATFI